MLSPTPVDPQNNQPGLKTPSQATQVLSLHLLQCNLSHSNSLQVNQGPRSYPHLLELANEAHILLRLQATLHPTSTQLLSAFLHSHSLVVLSQGSPALLWFHHLEATALEE